MVLLVVVNQFFKHAVQNCWNCEESFHCCANVVKALFIAKNLLYDKSSDSFGKSLTVLHDSETKWDYLGLHQKGYSVGITFLDQRPDNSQWSYSQVFENFAFRRCIQKWIQEERDMGLQKFWSGLRMQGQALEQSYNKTDSVGTGELQIGWRRELTVNLNNLLEQDRDSSNTVP